MKDQYGSQRNADPEPSLELRLCRDRNPFWVQQQQGARLCGQEKVSLASFKGRIQSLLGAWGPCGFKKNHPSLGLKRCLWPPLHWSLRLQKPQKQRKRKRSAEPVSPAQLWSVAVRMHWKGRAQPCRLMQGGYRVHPGFLQLRHLSTMRGFFFLIWLQGGERDCMQSVPWHFLLVMKADSWQR